MLPPLERPATLVDDEGNDIDAGGGPPEQQVYSSKAANGYAS